MPFNTDNLTNPETNDEAIKRLEGNYANTAKLGPKKQNPWLQGAFMALQALAHIANPEDQRPIQWLGQAKYQYNLDKIRRQLGPLYDARNTQQRAQAVSGAQVPVKEPSLTDSPIPKFQKPDSMIRPGLYPGPDVAFLDPGSRQDYIPLNKGRKPLPRSNDPIGVFDIGAAA